MFLLFALICGLIMGWTRGGSLARLSQLPIRHSWLILISFLFQILIFSSQFESLSRSDQLGAVLHIFSILLLLLAVGLNLSLNGMKILGLGILLNALVVISNGGYMPVSLDKLAQAGMAHRAELLRAKGHFFRCTALTSETRLPFFADVFLIPSWLPFKNVLSLGDVFIGIGVFILVIRAMEKRRRQDVDCSMKS